MFGVYPSWEFISKTVRHSRPRRHRPPWAGRLTPTPLVGSRKRNRPNGIDYGTGFEPAYTSYSRDWRLMLSDRLNSLFRAWGGAALLSGFAPWPAASVMDLDVGGRDGFGRTRWLAPDASRSFLDNPGVWSRKASQYCLDMRGVAFENLDLHERGNP